MDITMALLEFNIPEGVMWGDYFYESSWDSDSSRTLEYITTESDGSSDEWETISRSKVMESYDVTRPAKWCSNGNACQWKNCKFRHERCSHYDNWIKRGKKGNNCRCHATDPESNKSPDNGGCMYDHRDLTKLKMFIETLPCSTEDELWSNFEARGLDGHCADVYDVRKMSRMDRALLVRSLTAANVEFDDCGNFMYIFVE